MLRLLRASQRRLSPCPSFLIAPPSSAKAPISRAHSSAMHLQVAAKRAHAGSGRAYRAHAYRTDDGLKMRGSATLLADMDTACSSGSGRAPRPPGADRDGRGVPGAAAASDGRPFAELPCRRRSITKRGGESYQGQIAVAEVVINRVHSKLYPKTVCDVVYQGSARAIGCQFTFTCDGSVDRRPRGSAWARAQQVASQVLGGYARPMIGRRTHYHTDAVDPLWSSGMIENHAYRQPYLPIASPARAKRPMAQQALMQRRHAGSAVDDSDDDATPPAQQPTLIPEAKPPFRLKPPPITRQPRPRQRRSTAPNSEVAT